MRKAAGLAGGAKPCSLFVLLPTKLSVSNSPKLIVAAYVVVVYRVRSFGHLTCDFAEVFHERKVGRIFPRCREWVSCPRLSRSAAISRDTFHRIVIVSSGVCA